MLHPNATDEKEEVGLKAEFVEAEDMDDVVDQDVEDLEDNSTTLRPDIQYKPILQISSNDLFDVVHRRDGGALGSGRASVSTKRSRDFMQQYGGKYLEMKEPRAVYVHALLLCLQCLLPTYQLGKHHRNCYRKVEKKRKSN